MAAEPTGFVVARCYATRVFCSRGRSHRSSTMRLSWLGLVVALALVIVCFPLNVALAQDVEADISKLEETLVELDASLSTTDCDVACEALASMIRAADKLCELDAGPRCAAARERVDAAKRRVLEACPTCAVAADTEESQKKKVEAGGSGAPEPDHDRPEAVDSVQADGGCATCTVGHQRRSGDASHAFGAGLVALGFLLARRRRSSSGQ